MVVSQQRVSERGAAADRGLRSTPHRGSVQAAFRPQTQQRSNKGQIWHGGKEPAAAASVARGPGGSVFDTDTCKPFQEDLQAQGQPLGRRQTVFTANEVEPCVVSC